jgi:hypothetical protein
LPEIPLKDIAVFALEKITFLGGVFEDRGGLAEVGVYPDANFLDKS